jgi:hypothetical protein
MAGSCGTYNRYAIPVKSGELTSEQPLGFYVGGLKISLS